MSITHLGDQTFLGVIPEMDTPRAREITEHVRANVGMTAVMVMGFPACLPGMDSQREALDAAWQDLEPCG